ncbi:hypothetical protein PMKS-001029 [Pichia membranifaciens]|uniref:Uncharacterized protein n=1 Tax=Pichia membranifaciens TaxID=4926 RepID=A0A1Q2YDI0_9ASCO|nr:hypothetical protein PMKS-001029 [Pichia membranifaciens]
MSEQLIILLCPRWRAKGHPSGLGGARTVDAAAIGVVIGAGDAVASADIGTHSGAGIEYRVVCNAVGLHIEEPPGLLPRREQKQEPDTAAAAAAAAAAGVVGNVAFAVVAEEEEQSAVL